MLRCWSILLFLGLSQEKRETLIRKALLVFIAWNKAIQGNTQVV